VKTNPLGALSSLGAGRGHAVATTAADGGQSAGGAMTDIALASQAARPRRRRRVVINKRIAPYIFLLPFLLLFVVFLIIPLIYALDLSVYRKTLVGGTHFVWFDNYKRAFTDRNFWSGVWTLFKFGILQIPIMLILSLIFALILDSGIAYAKAFFRISFFIPYAVPAVIATLLWGYMYGPAYGPFAQLASIFGLPKPDFFNDSTIIPSIANIATWEYMGYNMIIYFAALQAIPTDLEEASMMDGASAFTFALRIKLPMIVPTIIVTIIFSIIGSLQLFTEPYLLINLARNTINSHFTPNLYAYTLAFIGQQYNYSAAISFVLGGVVAVVSYVFMLAANRRVSE
jgi:multiple sugar transport system permease protein